MGILDEYMKQVELDKLNENDEIATSSTDELEKQLSYAFDKEEYQETLQMLRNDPNDMANKFHKEYPSIKDEYLVSNNLLKSESINARLIHAYCPKCGRELICMHKLFVNSYRKEVIAKHECICGFKANLEHSYPRLLYTDANNKEIEIFCDKQSITLS